MNNNGECAEYFKNHPEYHRCMETLLRKWKTYGRAAGRITLTGVTDEERRAIGGIVGKTFQDDTIQFSVSAFEHGLQKTRFAPINLEELLKEYFGENISTNREKRQNAESRKKEFYERLSDTFRERTGSGGEAFQWIRDLADTKSYGYQILQREYSRNPEQAAKMAENVGKALESMETSETGCPLAVLAAHVTGNPHYFDRGTTAGQLLMHAICRKEKTDFPSGAHDWRMLWKRAGIIPDQISCIVYGYGVRLKTQDGWHPAYEAFCARKEVYALTMENLQGITDACTGNGKVYIVENEMVFSYLVDQCHDGKAAILCTSGQLRTAALELITLLLKSGNQVYYSGDTDPDGICIADRLWQKFGDGVRIWRMSPEDYQNSASSETIGSIGLSKLEHVCHPILEKTARLVQQKRVAGYQENILEDLKNDIIVHGHSDRGIEYVVPADIEQRSMELIDSELGDASHLTPAELLVVKRAIHATADFDYLENLKFSPGAVEKALEVLRQGAVIVTDTHMAEAGISKPALRALGCSLYCFMSDEDVAQAAREAGSTRAAAALDKAAREFAGQPLIFVIGNAPTALVRICEHMDEGTLAPELIIGAPVGFVNVVASKEMVLRRSAPYIVAAGRKGGSNVAAAICNALLYQVYQRQ